MSDAIDPAENKPVEEAPSESIEPTEAGESAPSEDADNLAEKSPQSPESKENKEVAKAVVRYGLMGNIGLFRCNITPVPKPGTKVAIRTERGVELGEITTEVCEKKCPGCITPGALDEFVEASGPDYPFRRTGKVLRIANQQDKIDFRHLAGSAKEECAYCRQQIEELGLQMRLVSAEHLLGGGRIIFYFTAESRVDFRELVKNLANQYHTRIEMRQVGARDEARLVADYERCGRQCCCKEFLKDLKPVSMRMAKTQKATLDPAKISGRCGRLMCCLRYEDVGYEELRKKLPRKNTWVRTDDAVGKVIDTQILTQLVRLLLTDGKQASVSVDDIIERDIETPQAYQAAEAQKQNGGGNGRQAPARRPDRKPQEQAAKPEEQGESSQQAQPGKPKKRRRRRRKTSGQGQQQNTSQKQGEGGDQPRKRKRRRRRRKPDGNKPGNADNSQ